MKLIICEKPSVAKTIAGALGAKEQKDGHIAGNGILVSWCVGHLVSKNGVLRIFRFCRRNGSIR